MKKLSKNYPQKMIVILGPTASGKSDLAVRLAKRLNGEVISADSRQVYKGMNLGSGKITKKEMEGVPHHLLDVASPRSRFSVAQYKKLAQKALKAIRQKNKLPIICGGTGFYIQAIADDLALPEVKPDWKLRSELEKKNTKELFSLLEKLDPERAKNIDRHNPRRLIRAIEIVKKTGQPVPKAEPKHNKNIVFLGIQKSKEELRSNIAKRLNSRLKKGMVKEVRNLHQSGLSWKKLESFGLEYRWIAQFLQNKISYEKMLERIQKESEHFAKRQMTWFKRDNRIYWIRDFKQASRLISTKLKN